MNCGFKGVKELVIFSKSYACFTVTFGSHKIGLHNLFTRLTIYQRGACMTGLLLVHPTFGPGFLVVMVSLCFFPFLLFFPLQNYQVEEDEDSLAWFFPHKSLA